MDKIFNANAKYKWSKSQVIIKIKYVLYSSTFIHSGLNVDFAFIKQTAFISRHRGV